MTRYKRSNKEGTVTRRSRRYRAQTPPIKGKRISRSFQTKAEAQEWLRSFQTQLDHGLDYQGGKICLADYLDDWLKTSRITLRQKTAEQYGRTIQKYIVPRIGSLALNELRLATIEQFYSELLLDGMGVRLVRIIHSILHRALNKAVIYDLLIKNPTQGAALPKYKHAEMKFLDESQIPAFLLAAQGSQYEALHYIAITTGMRQGELFGLQWADLHWNSGMLYVQRQSQRAAGKGWWFEEPKTRSGKRPILLGENTLQKLREHYEKQQLLRAFAGDAWHDLNLIFPNTVGNPGDPANLRHDFLKVLEQAGLPQIRFHDLRHTAASLMLNKDVPVITVSKRLGHAKPSTTIDIYGHLYPESREVAARVMDEVITSIPIQLPQRSQAQKTKPPQ